MALPSPRIGVWAAAAPANPYAQPEALLGGLSGHAALLSPRVQSLCFPARRCGFAVVVCAYYTREDYTRRERRDDSVLEQEEDVVHTTTLPGVSVAVCRSICTTT